MWLRLIRQHSSLTEYGLVAALGLMLLGPVVANAQSEQETRARLDQLNKNMAQLQRDLNTERAQKNTLQGQLRDAETALGKLAQAISRNRSKLREGQAQLDSLTARALALEKARQAQQARIEVEIRRAYQMGQDSQLKLILSQQQPDTLARAMAYYQYFYRARSQQLQRYRATLKKLAGLRQEIEAVTIALNDTNTTLDIQRQRLALAQKNRQQTLAKVKLTIASKDQQLRQLARDRQELEQLLKVIEEAAVVLSVPEDYKAFGEAQGNMPWPVSGKHRNRFGRPRNEGKMRWQGVTIAATEGATVEAIHHGRVVYADWLRGYGLLLIIDHGDGYMSLYAHNQTLLREVGEWVTAGTEVSTVGNTGGQEQSALYFEIRHLGKPVNPSVWCDNPTRSG